MLSDIQRTKSRVLVVDDGDDNRMLLSMILETADYEVQTAEDGPTALEMVRRDPPDLILLDVMMPGMDGYEVCARLKADDASRAIPVIFVTALSESEAETRSFELGAADFVTKPISMTVLLARVKTHLALYAQRRSLEGMFRDVIEFAPDAFVLTNSQGVITQINARAEELFGYPPQRVARPAGGDAGAAALACGTPGASGRLCAQDAQAEDGLGTEMFAQGWHRVPGRHQPQSPANQSRPSPDGRGA